MSSLTVFVGGATYHHAGRRKSNFHAAVALCGTRRVAPDDSLGLATIPAAPRSVSSTHSRKMKHG
jgi:hypothetical protein